MLINNKELSNYHCLLKSFSYTPSRYDAEISSTEMHHIKNSEDMMPSERELQIVFEDEKQIGLLYKELLNGATIDYDDGLVYDCLLLKEPAINHLGRNIYEVSFIFSCICKGELREHESNFIVDGHFRSSCIYEITSAKDLDSFTVDGYTIINLKVNKTFVIDGIDKLIYYQDTPELSAFDDTNLTKFPILEPGEHTIIKSDDAVNVVIKYYPTYL